MLELVEQQLLAPHAAGLVERGLRHLLDGGACFCFLSVHLNYSCM